MIRFCSRPFYGFHEQSEPFLKIELYNPSLAKKY